jgi:hypothetical protein
MPRSIEPNAEVLIQKDWGTTKVKCLVLSHIPGPNFRVVTGHLARCVSIESARVRLKRERTRTPNGECEYSIYDIAAKVLLDE